MKKINTFIALSITTLLISCGGSETEAKSSIEEKTEAVVEKVVESTEIALSNTETTETNEVETTKSEANVAKEETIEKSSTDAPKAPAPVLELAATKKDLVEETVEVEEEIAPPFNHEVFDGLLRKHVSANGTVNYKGFIADKAELEKYIKQLQDEYTYISGENRNTRLAYWINVYNAYTIKLIVDNYPTTSITKLKGGKPWDYKFIKLGDNNYSLNNVENDIIRPRFNDPRIHVGVNCASFSCPKLGNRAFTGSNVSSKLNALVKVWLKDDDKNQIATNSLKISKIFDWYKVDFTKNGKTVIDFINKYSDVQVEPGTKIEYLEYKWDLND